MGSSLQLGTFGTALADGHDAEVKVCLAGARFCTLGQVPSVAFIPTSNEGYFLRHGRRGVHGTFGPHGVGASRIFIRARIAR